MSDEGQIRDLTARLGAQVADENAKAAAERALKADYKIQIWFRRNRNLWDLNDYTLQAWESGKRLHGGGDELMRICRRLPNAPKPLDMDVMGMPNKEIAAQGGCGRFIPGGLVAFGRVACPHCQMQHKAEHIATSMFYRTSMTRAAQIIEEWWHRLDGRASLYAKYHPADPRSAAMQTEHGYRMAMEKKGLTVYTLQSIIKDTSTGRSIESAFRAFLTA